MGNLNPLSNGWEAVASDLEHALPGCHFAVRFDSGSRETGAANSEITVVTYSPLILRQT